MRPLLQGWARRWSARLGGRDRRIVGLMHHCFVFYFGIFVVVERKSKRNEVKISKTIKGIYKAGKMDERCMNKSENRSG